MGCCMSKQMEKHILYEPLAHKPYGLSKISEMTNEPEEEEKEMEVLHV